MRTSLEVVSEIQFECLAQRRDETERLFPSIVEGLPNEPRVYSLYGAFLMNVRSEEGVREMMRELEISPSHVLARLCLAEAIAKEEQFDEGFRLADETVKLEPNNPRTHQVLRELLVAKGDLHTGIHEVEVARQQSPDNIRAHWGLLQAYTSAGRANDAKQEKEQIESLGQLQAQP